jgi:hypothetical protein
MSATYTYSVSTDFSSGVNISRLNVEILKSSIVTTLEYINVGVSGSDNCDIVFESSLSGGDATTLNGIVASHGGTAISQEILEKSTSQSATTSTSWQQKVGIVDEPLTAGSYLIRYFSEVSCSATDTQMQACLLVDGSVIEKITFQPSTSVNEQMVFTGFEMVNLTAGDHTIRIGFKRVTGSGNAQIAETRLWIKKTKTST